MRRENSLSISKRFMIFSVLKRTNPCNNQVIQCPYHIKSNFNVRFRIYTYKRMNQIQILEICSDILFFRKKIYSVMKLLFMQNYVKNCLTSIFRYDTHLKNNSMCFGISLFFSFQNVDFYNVMSFEK